MGMGESYDAVLTLKKKFFFLIRAFLLPALELKSNL